MYLTLICYNHNFFVLTEFLREMDRASTGILYPDVEEDYNDSMDSLLRIQQYNNYTTQDVRIRETFEMPLRMLMRDLLESILVNNVNR